MGIINAFWNPSLTTKNALVDQINGINYDSAHNPGIITEQFCATSIENMVKTVLGQGS